jgi:hypothetical protein
MPTLYLAGPMRGLPKHNAPAFDDAARRLRALGFGVINPVDVCAILGLAPGAHPPQTYLRADIGQLATRASGIALLPGWETSVGARCEAAIAVTLGLPFFDALTGRPIETPTVTISHGYEADETPVAPI